jgi:retron-type reverse transcriptase
MRKFKDLFNKIADSKNLFVAWDEFKRDKGTRPDVLEFELNLESNIFNLSHELQTGIYKHGPYTGFFITDPKRRHVHKATVRDRILHHSVFSVLNPIFEPTFISASFSCQINKGSHRGVEALSKMLNKESRNACRPCYALKCDIQKFFDSINHDILLSLLSRRIGDKKVVNLLKELVGSYVNEAEPRERERERERVWRYAPKRNTYWEPYFPTLC